MGIVFSGVKNLILPKVGEQMRWGYILYDTSEGSITENLAYDQQQGMALVPQAIIVNTYGVSDDVEIIWDATGTAFPINVPPNVQRAMTVPAVDPVRFTINPSAGSTGKIRIDMVNFPLIPEDFTSFNSATGQNVNLVNPLTAPGNVQPIVAGAAVATANPLPVAPIVAGAAVAAANPIPSVVEVGASPVAVANPFPIAPVVAGAAVAASNPLPVVVPQVGAQANAWNDVAVAAGGVSSNIDTQGLANVSAFGSVSAATTIGVNVSEDNSTWYTSGITQALSAAGDFYISFTTGARYIQLSSLDAATITATVAAKA